MIPNPKVVETEDNTRISDAKPEHYSLCLWPEGLINIYANQDKEIIMTDM